MKLAAGNYTYPLYPFSYFLNSVCKMDIKYIELWAAGPHLYLNDFTGEMLDKMAREIKDAGLQVVCFTPEQCIYPINIAARETYIRTRSIDYFKKSVDAASRMGIEKVLVTPGQGYRNESAQEAYCRSVESLQTIATYAKSHGVGLLLEHLTHNTTNVAVTAAETVGLMKDTGADNIKVMIDTDMAARIDESPKDYIREIGGLVEHVHFVDGMPGGHLAPGDGVLPMRRYYDELEARGYDGFLTLEVMHPNYLLDPDSALKKSAQWFAKQGINID